MSTIWCAMCSVFICTPSQIMEMSSRSGMSANSAAVGSVPALAAFVLAPLLLRQVHVQLAPLLRSAKFRLLALDSHAVADAARLG